MARAVNGILEGKPTSNYSLFQSKIRFLPHIPLGKFMPCSLMKRNATHMDDLDDG